MYVKIKKWKPGKVLNSEILFRIMGLVQGWGLSRSRFLWFIVIALGNNGVFISLWFFKEGIMYGQEQGKGKPEAEASGQSH